MSIQICVKNVDPVIQRMWCNAVFLKIDRFHCSFCNENFVMIYYGLMIIK